jgi:hypothetical protein
MPTCSNTNTSYRAPVVCPPTSGRGRTLPPVITSVCLCLITLLQLRLTSATVSTPPTVTERAAFLQALEGAWHGAARVTPVGPRPYDITFTRTDEQALHGAAVPGASTHYWTFYEADGVLKLRFLSTFAGNRQPLFLSGTTTHEGLMVFHATPAEFLEVRVQPQADTVTIHIILRGKPHVEIVLTRKHQ